MIDTKKNDKRICNAAIFMSGTGANAERILEEWSNEKDKNWQIKLIVTDNPSCRAKELANKFNIHLIEHNIKAFYISKGLKTTSIKTKEGQAVREEWTNSLRDMIKKYEINLGILAGFVPLTNITSDFPCLNIHPGDLTVEENGKRVLVGLHNIPIELAILRGDTSLRSSVIVAEPYSCAGGDMDSGPIISLSPKVQIDLLGHTLTELIEIQKSRKTTKGNDSLAKVANYNLNKLKVNGDLKCFYSAIKDYISINFN